MKRCKINAHLAMLLLVCDVLFCHGVASLSGAVSILHRFGESPWATGLAPRTGVTLGPEGELYGTLSEQEGDVVSSIYRLNPDGTGFTVLKAFKSLEEGWWPVGSLALDGESLYGATAHGGDSGNGVLFVVKTNGAGFQQLKNFAGIEGKHPLGVVLASNALYGATAAGGNFGAGTIFKINTDGSSFEVLRHLNPSTGDGVSPSANLTVVNGSLFGTTTSGGTVGIGTIFRIELSGSGFTTLHSFGSPESAGSGPTGGLFLSGNSLFGTTSKGTGGSVFRINVDGTDFREFLRFPVGNSDSEPLAGVVVVDNTVYGTTMRGGDYSYGALFRVQPDGSHYERVKSFSATYGWTSIGNLAVNGNTIFGTTEKGGPADRGTVFKIQNDGSNFEVLKNFVYSDGWKPSGVASFGSSMLGVTLSGGSRDLGSVFRANLDGSNYSILLSFNQSTGTSPAAHVASHGNYLYGVTLEGGQQGGGTLYRISQDGTDFSVLQHFGAFSPLGITISESTIYGLTRSGGVFKCNLDGSGFSYLPNPNGETTSNGRPLVIGTNIYVARQQSIYHLNTDGTGYRVLKQFSTECCQPQEMNAVLTSIGDVLYGSSFAGGEFGVGTIFKMNTDGSGFEILKNFTLDEGGRPITLIAYRGRLFGTFAVNKIFKLDPASRAFETIQTGIINPPAPFTEGVGISFISDGKLLGTSSIYPGRRGTVFSIDGFSRVPVATDATFFRSSGSGLEISIADLLTNYVADPDGTSPVLLGVGQSTSGATIEIDSSAIRYMPTNDLPDQFSYTVTDETLDPVSATISIRVIGEGGQIQSIHPINGTLRLAIAGIPGAAYEVQYSTNLVNWTRASQITIPSSGLYNHTEPTLTAPSFFRMIRR